MSKCACFDTPSYHIFASWKMPLLVSIMVHTLSPSWKWCMLDVAVATLLGKRYIEPVLQ